MPDPRVAKLAQVLVSYSLDLQPGEEFYLQSNSLADELNLAVYEAAVRAGSHVWVQNQLLGAPEIFFKHADDAQLDYVSPVEWLLTERFTASLYIGALENTRELSNIDPSRQRRSAKAHREVNKIFIERSGRGELKWCFTVFPTHAGAQEASMSLREYQDFVYGAGKLDKPDPVAAWQEMQERHNKFIEWLSGREQVVLKGKDIDLQLSIQGRSFISADGKSNFPDGEIFSSPVEESVNGWVRSAYPGIYAGREVENIELWFENGKVVREKASKGQTLLTELLNTDEEARYVGEWGIGTNYDIQQFTKHMLFDEKIGGTIHFAVGSGFPEAGGQNESSIHWDMLCDMSESEITVDGELFYQNGEFKV